MTSTSLQLVTDQTIRSQKELETRHKKGHAFEASWSQAFSNLIYVRRDVRFDIVTRPYLPVILEADCPEVTMKCGRQVGKSWRIGQRTLLADGSWKLAEDVVVGDRLAALDHDGSSIIPAPVTWVSDIYTKDCVRITTRQGHVLEVAKTHPLRKWNAWVPAGDLRVKDRVAAMRRLPNAFTGRCCHTKARIRLTAYLLGDGLGDGGLTQREIRFTSLPDIKLAEFKADVEAVGATWSPRDSSGRAVSVGVLHSEIYVWLRADGLRWEKDSNAKYGTSSSEKFVPSWVYDLSQEDTALFLNRLWSTDGCVKARRNTVSVTYCSVSPRLIKDVQALLWKFGVPSSIRKRQPKYRRDRGTEKYAYELRVETQDGVRTFLSAIGALTKSDKVSLPAGYQNNNRDTYPIEIGEQISNIIASRGDADRHGCQADTEGSLRTAGLRQTLRHPLSRQKLAQYIEFFKADHRYDQWEVAKLSAHVDTDIFWDEIVEIEDLGVQECVDYTVSDVHNFVVEGVVTHNTTMDGGKGTLHCFANPGYGHLYVAPRGDQAQMFSRMVFDSMMRMSPVLSRQIPTGKNEAWQLGTKVLKNGSYFYFKSAFHSADGIRGITAGQIFKDEVQDLVSDHQAVIDECAANWVDAKFYNSGTPKTFSNLLEMKWQRSTQAEWLIKCGHCNFWNYQDETLVGLKSLICKRCGGDIDPKQGQWVMGAPGRKDVHQGFRITQFMNPNVMAKYWKLREKLETYPKVQFYNEVLGLSFAEGDAVLSREDIIRACHPTRRNNPVVPASFGGVVTSGVDYGSGNLMAKRARGETQRSYTVLVSGAFNSHGVYEVFYMKKFQGIESDVDMQPRWINTLLHQNRSKVCMADWGFGAVQNRRMINEFGWSPQRFVEVQESAGQKDFVKWNPAASRYIINRNEMFVRVIEDIKQGRIVFPHRQDMEDFVPDFTSIYVELNGVSNERRYDHTFPDDAFHALAYAYITALLDAGVLSRYVMPPNDNSFW